MSITQVDMKKLLDLFCGVGGASMGYHRAGFAVYGIDNKPQPHYPFPFLLMDALEAMDRLLRGEGLSFNNGETLYLKDFVAYHASPPCQAFSRAFSMLIGHRKEHPDLVDPTRQLLLQTDRPFVIENVVGSPLRDYIQLEGTMFGLEVKKVRNFELHGFDIWMLPAKPDNTRGWIKSGRLVGMMKHTIYPNERVNRQELAAAYEMGWFCTRHELRQAIPPAYTEYIGKHLLKVLSE